MAIRRFERIDGAERGGGRFGQVEVDGIGHVRIGSRAANQRLDRAPAQARRLCDLPERVRARSASKYPASDLPLTGDSAPSSSSARRR